MPKTNKRDKRFSADFDAKWSEIDKHKTLLSEKLLTYLEEVLKLIKSSENQSELMKKRFMGMHFKDFKDKLERCFLPMNNQQFFKLLELYKELEIDITRERFWLDKFCHRGNQILVNTLVGEEMLKCIDFFCCTNQPPRELSLLKCVEKCSEMPLDDLKLLNEKIKTFETKPDWLQGFIEKLDKIIDSREKFLAAAEAVQNHQDIQPRTFLSDDPVNRLLEAMRILVHNTSCPFISTNIDITIVLISMALMVVTAFYSKDELMTMNIGCV